MTTLQQNLSLVKRLFDEVYSKGKSSAMDQFFTNDVKLNDPAVPHPKPGLPFLKERETLYEKAFPNKQLKIDEIFGTEDNKVVVRWTCQATHKGNFLDIPASGKNIKVTGISIYQFSNGKISHIFQNWDRLSLMEQIGAIEPVTAIHQ